MIITVIYATFAVEKGKPEKNSALSGILTFHFYDTSAALYQLSKQANFVSILQKLHVYLQ